LVEPKRYYTQAREGVEVVLEGIGRARLGGEAEGQVEDEGGLMKWMGRARRRTNLALHRCELGSISRGR